MPRRRGALTAVKAANAVDEAKALERAAAHYHQRLGEPGVDAELVAAVAAEAAKAQTDALLTACAVEGSLLIGPKGRVEVADAMGKGRRSKAGGPRGPRDAIYRLVALILGNPLQREDTASIYRGLVAYDAASSPHAGQGVTAEDVETFCSVRALVADEDALVERLAARMGGLAAEVAAEECADCRRFRALAVRRDWPVKPCRACQRKEVA